MYLSHKLRSTGEITCATLPVSCIFHWPARVATRFHPQSFEYHPPMRPSVCQHFFYHLSVTFLHITMYYQVTCPPAQLQSFYPTPISLTLMLRLISQLRIRSLSHRPNIVRYIALSAIFTLYTSFYNERPFFGPISVGHGREIIVVFFSLNT